MSARGFGPFGIIIEDDMPHVAFVSDASGEELVITPDTLPDLRRALDWLELEWGGGAEQPRLPLGVPHLEQALAWARARFMSTVKCATCPHFVPTRTDEGTPIAVCNYAASKGGFPVPRVASDGSDYCHHHPDYPQGAPYEN